MTPDKSIHAHLLPVIAVSFGMAALATSPATASTPTVSPQECCLCVPIGKTPGGKTAWSCPCDRELGANHCVINLGGCSNIGNCPGG